MADLTPLNLADSLVSFLSLLVLYFFKQLQFRRHTLAFQFTNFVDKPNFRITKYFSVICLPYLFYSLVYQTLYHFKLRGMKEFSKKKKNNGKEGDERIQQWTNYNGATGKLDC